MAKTTKKTSAGSSAGAMNVSDAVRKVCLALPETEEVIAHGSPDFRVRGRTFASYLINHHGDGHVALWLRAPPGAQQLYTEMEPEFYFVPPYVGPKGWLGVELNTGLSWQTIALRVREAFDEVAPAELRRAARSAGTLTGPVTPLRPEEINPFLRQRASTVLARLDTLCMALPETSRGRQFGNPVWKAGKKTFCSTHHRGNRLQLAFRVGAEQQTLLTLDPRFSIPPYSGHNGWIELDVETQADWDEIRELALISYRHFALKRMLNALEAEH